MSKLRNSLVLVTTALVVGACGGDDDPLGVNSGDAMTEEEIAVVFGAIVDAFGTIGATPAAGPARATVSVNETFEGSAPCDGGGTIGAAGSANGTIDDVTFVLDLTYALRVTPDGCSVPTESGSIMLDGSPYIQLDMDFFFSETQIDVTGTQSGGIAFTSTDGRSGTCQFDVQFSVDYDQQTQSGNSSTSGTVCGVSASNVAVWELT